MTIHFEKVGRGKKSWDSEITGAVTHQFLLREIRRNNALISRDIDFYVAEDGTSGKIFAGLRSVGTFRIDQAVVLPPLSLS
jgi:hypothetical protein